MHTNHRRKKPTHHNPKHGGGGRAWRGQTSFKWMRREFWQWYRAQEKQLFAQDRYDDFEDHIRPSILWDWC